MLYRLNVTETAGKQIQRIARPAQGRVRDHIRGLASDPRPIGHIKLRGGHYRIRVGDYRVIYSINDADRVVTILKVKHRKDVYRDL